MANINCYKILNYQQSKNIDFFRKLDNKPLIEFKQSSAQAQLANIGLASNYLISMPMMAIEENQPVDPHRTNYEEKFKRGFEKGYSDEISRLIYHISTSLMSQHNIIFNSLDVCEIMGIDPKSNFTLLTKKYDINQLNDVIEIKGFNEGYQAGSSKARVKTMSNIIEYNKKIPNDMNIFSNLAEEIKLTAEESKQLLAIFYSSSNVG